MYGLSLESEPARVYPQTGGGPHSSLAAHLLGFVNREGGGQYGVEQQYQATLGGEPRIVVAERDASGLAILDDATVSQPGTPGTDLTLTIDAGLQLRLEQELLAAWVADKAKRISAVVMDPYTGEVYASASYPSYDGNDYKAIAAKDPWRFVDPTVSAVYEPGSVFKMMTAAAALTQGTVTPSTRIKDVGTLRLDKGRTKIDDADRKGMGWMTFEDAVAYSRNVVAAKVALKLGKSTKESSAILYDMWMKLGYGAPTGIDVAGEVGGLVRDPGITDWRQIDLANAAFGQGVAVTPIQLATAYAALANGGTLVQPHVVKAVGDREIVTAPRAEGRRGRLRVGHDDPHDEARHHRGPVLPRPDARPRLRRRRQDGHGADLGSAREQRPRGVETQPLQLLVRRMDRTRDESARPRRRGPDRGGYADDPASRPYRDASHVVRALPTDRDRRDHDPRSASGASRPDDPAEGPVTGGYGTLAPVTDVDPSPATSPSATGPERPPTSGLTADDLVRLTGGRLLVRSDRPVLGAAVDSRLVEPGQLFVALPGERTDGHAYLSEAIARGAAAVLVARPLADGLDLGDVTAVRVADPLAALGAVAAGWRRRFDPLVVGVTGSIAKTSTKEAVAAVLGRRFRTLAQRGQPEQRGRACRSRSCASAPSTRRRSSRWGCTSAARSPTSRGSRGRGSAW